MNKDNPENMIHRGKVSVNKRVATGHFLLGVALAPTFSTPLPGQFVMLRNLHNGQSLLSRPFSVFGFRKEEQGVILELLCRIAGRETLRLSELEPGAEIEIMGPLGRGFSISPGVDTMIVVAGGVGVAPLSFLLKELKELVISDAKPSVTAFLGAKNAELVFALGESLKNISSLHLATDDGSAGYHGLVTDLLAEELLHFDHGTSRIFACGPTPMAKALAHILTDRTIHCQVSLEERMACGVGACLGCVIPARGDDGQTVYKRVCKDGPVFDIREIVW